MPGQFLKFMARDIATNPQRLQVVDAELIARLDNLLGDAEVDLDQPLSAEDEWCELEAAFNSLPIRCFWPNWIHS